jgi:hypothetical protein
MNMCIVNDKAIETRVAPVFNSKAIPRRNERWRGGLVFRDFSNHVDEVLLECGKAAC